jgi:hypothetical protein
LPAAAVTLSAEGALARWLYGGRTGDPLRIDRASPLAFSQIPQWLVNAE